MWMNLLILDLCLPCWNPCRFGQSQEGQGLSLTRAQNSTPWIVMINLAIQPTLNDVSDES